MNIIHDLCDLEERTPSSLKISYIVSQTLTAYANQGPEHLFFYFSSQLTGKSGGGGQLTLQTQKNTFAGFENTRVYRLQIVPVPARLTGKNI